MRKHGRPEVIVTDKLRSYGAALKEIGADCSAGNRSLGQQPGGEFAPAVPTTGAGDAPVPAHAKFAEIRRRPRLRLQPLQPGTQPLQPNHLQAEPRRRSRRVARSLRGIRGSVTVLAETGSNSSDSTPAAVRRRHARRCICRLCPRQPLPEVTVKPADPHEADVVEHHVAVAAVDDVPEEDGLAVPVIGCLCEGAGAGNGAAAVVEPVPRDPPRRCLRHLPRPATSTGSSRAGNAKAGSAAAHPTEYPRRERECPCMCRLLREAVLPRRRPQRPLRARRRHAARPDGGLLAATGRSGFRPKAGIRRWNWFAVAEEESRCWSEPQHFRDRGRQLSGDFVEKVGARVKHLPYCGSAASLPLHMVGEAARFRPSMSFSTESGQTRHQGRAFGPTLI